MKELMVYVELLKKIVSRYYEKEMIFYNNGEWYSREHSRNISLEELEEWIYELTSTEEDYEDELLPCGCCACCGCSCGDEE